MFYAAWVIMPWGPEWRVHRDGRCVEMSPTVFWDSSKEAAEKRAAQMNERSQA